MIRDLLLDPEPPCPALNGGRRGSAQASSASAGEVEQAGTQLSASTNLHTCAGQQAGGKMQKWGLRGSARVGKRLFLGGGLCETLTRACALGTMSSAKLDYTWDPIHNGLGAAAAGAAAARSSGSMPCRVSNIAALDAIIVPRNSRLHAAHLAGIEHERHSDVGGQLGLRKVTMAKVVSESCTVEAAGVTATTQPSDHYPLVAQLFLLGPALDISHMAPA